MEIKEERGRIGTRKGTRRKMIKGERKRARKRWKERRRRERNKEKWECILEGDFERTYTLLFDIYRYVIFSPLIS